MARFEPIEARLFRLSPLPFALTSLLIFVSSYGLFVAIAQITQQPPLYYVDESGTLTIPQVSWIALVLSLILTAGLTFSAGAMALWTRERTTLHAALTPSGQARAEGLARGIPVSWKLRYSLMFWLGALAGLAFNIILMMSMGTGLAAYAGSVGLWFLLLSPPLYGIGFRAWMDVARESGEIKTLLRDHLEIDLFHLDRLAVFGRIGLKAARSWLAMAAILLLFLIDPENPSLFAADQLVIAGPMMMLSIAGGLFMLYSALSPVHGKIRAAKAAELERIHAQMAELRPRALAGDTEAAGALAGLTDYEVWVDNRPEWPVSEGLTTRLSLYILLPILPILGSYVFEKLADQLVSGSPA